MMIISCLLAILAVISTLSSSSEQTEEISWFTTAIARNIEGYNVTNKYLDDKTILEKYNWIDHCCENFPCQKTCSNCEWENASVSSSSSSSHHCMKVRVVPRTSPEPLGYDHSSTECLLLLKLEDDLMNSDDFDLLHRYHRKFSKYSRPKFPRAFRLFRYKDSEVCLSEIVKGLSLRSHMRNVKTDVDAYDFIIAMLDTLSMLRRSSIIHRDIEENNILVTEDGGSYSIRLIDFTWGYSPTVKGMFLPPDCLNRYHRAPDPGNIVRKTGIFNAEDVYSMGSLIKDMLIMYTDVDTFKWSGLFDAMMSYCDILNCADIALQSLMTSESEVAELKSIDIDAERERQELCNDPNMFAGTVQVHMGLVEEPDSDDKVPLVRTSGYQSFELVRKAGGIQFTPLSIALSEKSDVVSPVIRQVAKGMTVLDIGGNYGFFSALSVAYGAESATIVDMDKRYTTKASEMYEFLGSPFSERIDIQNKKLSEMNDFSADVVIALALVHWSFNCSETTGNLARTIGHLARRAKKLLIVEWIEPYDPAIQLKNHLSQKHLLMTSIVDDNPDIGSSMYSFANFNNTMRRIFKCANCFQELKQQVSTPSRRIFVGIHMKPSIVTETDGENVTMAALDSKTSKYTHINNLFGVAR